ncbi:MAG TPA: hypothetical protein VK172_10440 [Lentimicrobium sp.]|nr:hypothetical protein [Lentimicrobium sp.]
MSKQKIEFPEGTPEIISKIDYDLLRQQKQDLLKVINKKSTTIKQKESLEGILMLLDNLQDYVVDELGIPEDQIFELGKE